MKLLYNEGTSEQMEGTSKPQVTRTDSQNISFRVQVDIIE